MSKKHAPLITIKNSNKKNLKRAAESCGHKKIPHSMLDGGSKIDAPFVVSIARTYKFKKIHSFIHSFILFSIISKQFNAKNYKYWKDQEKEEAAQRQTLKHA